MVDMTTVCNAVISLATALVTVFLIPYIKSKLDAGKQAAFANLVDVFVGAAEQIYSSTQTKEKKAYVVAQLEAKGYTVDTDEVNAQIEAAVLAVHNALKVNSNENKN